MRLILKTKNGHFKMYWITADANRILGWFSGDWLRKELNIPDDKHFESHFTYPKDGDFHNSYKSINDEDEEFISVYWDRVRTKKIVKGVKSDIVITRQEFVDNKLNYLSPEYKPLSLDLVTNFPFTTVSLNIFKGSFKLIRKLDSLIEENQLEDSDLIVDVSDLDNVCVNIGAGIQPTEVVSTAVEPRKIYCKHSLLTNSRHLELRCIIIPLT